MLDNKDFWDDFLNSGGEPSDIGGKTSADPALDPGYRAEDKPTALGSPEKRISDIDALLADIHRQKAYMQRAMTDGSTARNTSNKGAVPTVSEKQSVHSGPSPVLPLMNKPTAPAANRAAAPPNSTPPAPPANVPPKDAPSDDRQIVREMTEAMRELTEELRRFRAQMEESPYDSASHPHGRPEITKKTALLSDTLDTVITDDPAEMYFPVFVPEGHGGAAPEASPNIRGESEAEASSDFLEEKKKPNKALSIISNILFYVVIVAMVLGAFLMRSAGKGQPFMLAGFSAANVLTSSMEDVYPRGSLIITKSVDPSELQIGDDITFMVSEDTSITHRIISITESYQGTGQRAFETKGTKNPNPDKEMVVAANVVGKVIFSSKTLGDIANFVKANWPILIFVLIVIIGLITFLKWNAKKSDGDEEGKVPKAKKEKNAPHSKK